MSRDFDEVNAAIGGSLRKLRKQRGMSLEAVGNVIGMTYQQVQKYETGRNRISARNLYVLARFFEVDITAFFSGMTTEPPELEIAAIAAKLDRIAREHPEAAKTLFALVTELVPAQKLDPR